MTDDKGASDYHPEECNCECYKDGLAAGRKAERERCLAISIKHSENCVSVLGCAEAIENEIRGGQDAK